MDEKKEKRVLRVELGDEVKKLSITGLGSDEKVVMRQELDEEDLELATGGSLREFAKSLDGLDDKEKRVEYHTSNLTKIPCNENFYVLRGEK